MSTKLGTLTLDLVARIGNFTGPITQAEREAKKSSNNIADGFNIASVAAKALGVSIAGISASGIISFASQSMNAGNEIKKFSELANSSTRDFQYFAKGAETAGISLEKFADINKDVLDRLGEVSRGEGEMMDFFEKIAPKIGVTADQFKNLSGPEALQAYYNGLQKANLSHEEQITYMEQIANDASLLIPLLKNGGEGFQKWGDAAERANAIMSEEMIGNLAIAKENVRLLNLQWEGAKNTLINGSMPAIQATIDNMDTLTNVTTIAGVYLAGTYIPTLAIATKTLVTDTIAKISNIASTRAKTVADYDIAKSNLAATAAMVKAMGATNAQTAAMMTNARAAYQQASAAKFSMLAGSGLLGVLGGPVGLGITVASVAAGYLLMKDGAEVATASIDIQGKSVADLVVKYRELNTLQRDNETKVLADQVEDLGLKYRVASSDLYSFMEALPVSDEKIATFNKLRSELSQGRISSNEYYEAVKNVNILTDSQLGKVRALTGGYGDAKTKFNEAETAQDVLAKSMGSTTQQVKEQAIEVAGLGVEIKKLLSENATATQKNNLISSIVDNAKVDSKLAEMIADARKKAGILGTGKSLPDDVVKSIRLLWDSEKSRNKSVEKGNELEDKRKKLIEAQGDAMKVNALVASNAAKANASALESAKNLPKGLLSAVNMVESPRSNFATSGAGAGGPMQFMPATADRYKVDIKSVESSYRGASNYLKDLLKMFDGDIENALRAYNWGEGNMQNYLKYGSGMKNGQKGYFSDKPMPKETREYSGKVMGHMGGASGVSFTEKYSYDDWFKEQEKFSIEREKFEKEQAKKQLDLTNLVATEKVRINSKLAEDIKNIGESGFTDTESKNLIAEYQRRADIDIQIAEAAQSDKLADYSDYAKSEEQLINQSYARRQRDLKLDIQFTADQYTEASLHLEKQRIQEIEKAHRTQKLDLLEAKRDWMDKGAYASEYYALIRAEILATASFSPEMKDVFVKQANIQQGVDQNAEREGIWGDYKSIMGLDESPYQQDIDLLAEARAQMLITEEEYQQQRLGMQIGYGSQYGADFAGMMMGLVDQSSSAYAVLYSVQKGFNLASAIMNGYTAISAAWASAPFPYNMPAVAMATMETGVLRAAISAVSPVGMAHDGIDNIPKEGTWLLDGGERVLNPQQNKDLTKYLNDARGNTQVNTPIDNQIRVAIFDDRADMMNQMYGREGEKVVMYHLKRNGMLKA